MPISPKEERTRWLRQASVTLFFRATDIWRRSMAWTFGPVLVGLAAVLLAIQSEYASTLNKLLFTAVPLAPLLIMPLGFPLIAFISSRYFPGTAGSGIPQTITAINEMETKKKSSLLSLHIVVGKVLLTLASLAIGASVGREGPTVQIGAAIMYVFYGRSSVQTAEQRRILILAGGAAGIAAAFNTPLAGIMFGIEELSKKHVLNGNSYTLITVAFAGLTSLFLLGNYTYFGSTNATIDWHSGTPAVVICGVIGGLSGGIFSRMMLAASSELSASPSAYLRKYPLAFAAVCGLIVALIGLLTKGMVFGTGYEVTRQTLESHSTLPWYFSITKMAATLLSALSGIPGGLFAPSLAVGAGIGDNIAMLFPSLAPHSAIVVLAMTSYLSGVTRAPMTSFIIMMEMTNSHHMLLPLMAATVMATSMSRLICPASPYSTLAERFFLRHEPHTDLPPEKDETAPIK